MPDKRKTNSTVSSVVKKARGASSNKDKLPTGDGFEASNDAVESEETLSDESKPEACLEVPSLDTYSSGTLPVVPMATHSSASADGLNSTSIAARSPSLSLVRSPSPPVVRTSTPENHEWPSSPKPPAISLIPVDYGVNEEVMREYNQKLIKRIAAFISYEKSTTNTYAAGRMPSHAWGTGRPLDDKSGILCKPMSNEPLTFWIIGQVSKMWFFNSSGQNVPQVAINVVPLSPSIGNICRKTLTELSFPVTGEPLSNRFRMVSEILGRLAGRPTASMVVRGRTQAAFYYHLFPITNQTPQPVPFLNVFDAREIYSGKHDMDRIEIEEVSLRDLVLVEANIARYKLKDEANQGESSTSAKKKRASVPWEKWRAHYELLSISLLHKTRFPTGLTQTKEGEPDDVI